METERSTAQKLPSQQRAHLKVLKPTIAKTLEDGQVEAADIDHIKSIIWVDGKVIYEELPIR